MLCVKDEQYHQKVLDFAASIGLSENLEKSLSYLANYAGGENTRCVLYRDWAPYSYEFVMERRDDTGIYRRWFNGGLIYHGSHDGHGSGSAPTFSCTLTPTSGWSIHT